jgi:AcrR family transcriptional regulator
MSHGDEEAARRSPRGRRALQAEQTRSDILAAARARFARDGYASTSLKDIAADAGVSVQTVYDSVGAKADLVRTLNDFIDREAQIGEIAMLIVTEADPAVIARLPARVTRRLVERCGDILRAVVTGVQVEPGLVPLVEEGGRRHRAGTNAVAGRLAGLGALRPDLSVGDAATAIAALADFRVAIVLLDEYAMSFDALEVWMGDAIARVVLR